MDLNFSTECSNDDLMIFSKHLSRQMLQVNALLAMNSILMGIMVGIGAYGQRYRHHPLTRFLFICATTLFLPVVSYVVSASNNQNIITVITTQNKITMAVCYTSWEYILVWTALIQIVGINTIAIVASDAREGRNIAPPTVLLVQTIWTSYLAATLLFVHFGALVYELLILLPFALTFVKLLFKCYAWWKARRSLGLGRNLRLIVGYMEQLQDRTHHAELTRDHIPPSLIVMGEDTVKVEKKPRGYNIKSMSNTGDGRRINNNSLVTIDKVWELDGMLLGPLTNNLKDLCFSFALFKLLRCRFARYTPAEAGFMKAYNFLRHILLEDRDDERILVMVADELSFLQDYYYSSLPISYSKSCLPFLNILLSLLSIGYCLFAINELTYFDRKDRRMGERPWEMSCAVQCNIVDSRGSIINGTAKYLGRQYFGNTYFVLVPVYLLCALVVLAEARDIVSYICSNWTKVALICHYVNHASWRQSLIMQKCIGRVLQCRCKMVKHWEDKMNQCSIMMVHPRKTSVAQFNRLIPLPDQNMKIPRAVKVVVINALRRYERSRQDIETSMRRILGLQVGENILWMLNGAKGTSDTILVCHIATSILEVRSHPYQSHCDYKIAAIHLSRYCAYLVAYCPELLPDDDKWCKSLYKAVKKDAKRVLGGGIGVSTPDVEYEKLVTRLRLEPNHEVLKNGAELGKQLAELVEGEETAWKVLANFWSELILYVAPSDNINGHAEAIARGGELITLLWALLTHLGIVNRSDDIVAGTTDGAPVVV